MNIIFKTVFGSHLYGTNTENSDTDTKGVYIEPLENIILGKDRKTVNFNSKSSGAAHRNLPTDTDIELKELREFLKDCMDGQTYALDMLFAPPAFWNDQETTPMWINIISNRDKLLSKNVKPYIGYCRQQAGKYGLKGSRLGELKRVIEHLKTLKPHDKLIDHPIVEGEFVKLETTEYLPKGRTEPIIQTYLNVLGKKFEITRHVKEILPSLELMDEKYGHRAKLAANNEGIDWKAISHAFRCCYQLLELAETGKIAFPLLQAEKVKQIKMGNLRYIDIQDELFNLMEKAIKAVENSQLPDEPDRNFWDDFILHTYVP